MNKLENAKDILKQIGMPASQQSDLCGYTLLALAGVLHEMPWNSAQNEFKRIHDIIIFLGEHYDVKYAENSRETIRKQALHLFRLAAIVEDNGMPTNSPKFAYKLTDAFLSLLRVYGTDEWTTELNSFLNEHESLKEKFSSKREMTKVPVTINGCECKFSTGSHNLLQKAIIEEFAPRFARGAQVLYVGDTAKKDLIKDREKLAELGILLGEHEKLPDVILYCSEKQWIYFIEAVTSVGPISQKRMFEIDDLSKNCKCGKVFVTAFLNMKIYKKFANELAWETEVWIAENPEHMIHLNGDKFIGPRS